MVSAYRSRWERVISLAVASGKARARVKLKKRYRRERKRRKVEEPKKKPYRVHIKADYSSKKHHEIDYEAEVVVTAEGEDEAVEEALDQMVRELERQGYPVVWDHIEIGVEDADPDEVGEGRILVRGREVWRK